MDIYKIRIENARTLMQKVGGISNFSDKIGKAQSQVSRMIGIKPSKNIGSKIAREIEIKFNKELGWLDQPHDGMQVSEPAAQYGTVNTGRAMIHRTIDQLNDEEIVLVDLFLKGLAYRSDSARKTKPTKAHVKS
jgi:hypothetical protein